MIKIYGMDTCPDCAYIKEQIENNPNFEYMDIGSHVRVLKEFLKIRDNSEIFLHVKENGQIGIPCFVLEDGRITLDAKEAGLKNRPDENPAFCSLGANSEGKRC
ncbi:hypothetical protein Cst_c14660 [Thermoclostridium stercorarium subsp. stercorarium DSM 8532]|uniref:Glutaredoxin-related protein n=3 Tax=Thermoclostridium stercorarium TaxID=1510 RepID=L7VJZ8_THES1|nr:hypothetical protein [Thermoclostridium stercorarium]AGC68455.1 hypothetical protein Cst_c14660 [Thermoclostridium stercorarium subsp. stercorarium DSM 8532]AGI39474.1 glutaredoxin-like protein [Thermoclostridium stercorarium subsp. stercorarium DSM 8532]ANW98821.1 glutaredoxin-related protein [Thermoclostridium stercorarium subsp. thermolacticum DSM 2910]ANX01346.1 glutaredoxin-related protein [Thermoclostridium stercorarium subsp. leptospartum DSM 9219]UZQ84450.1 glutaredoxin-related prot